MDSSKINKAMSYKDLIRSFHQVEIKTPNQKSAKPRALQLKKCSIRQNKQNLPCKPHSQSLLQHHHQSFNWPEQESTQRSPHSKDRQQQLTYNKFITTITRIMMELTGTYPPELLMAKITYLQFLQALQQMALIKTNYDPAPNDLVSELWNELCGFGQTVGTFILVAASILNMHSPQYKLEKYQYLWNKYAELRYTRLEQVGKTKASDNEQEFPFSPKLCQRSRDLIANRSRSKDQRDRCLAEKTFCQSIDSNAETSRQKQLFDCKAGNRRSDLLYKMAKQRSVQKRRDKLSCDVEYQKSITQLTFHPKVSIKLKERPAKAAIQGEQDSIDRMIRGRIQREVRRIIQEKGLPYNQKMFQRMKRERYNALIKARTINLCRKDSQSPQPNPAFPQPATKEERTVKKSKSSHPLVLSIEIDEGRCEKLVIQEGECYKQVAAKFIADLKLDPDLFNKLVAGVQHALKFQLEQIDQDSFESMCESPRQ